MRRTLLYVSYHSPHGGGSAAHRTAKIARHLAGADWDVVVLCGPSAAAASSAAPEPYRLVSVPGPFDRTRVAVASTPNAIDGAPAPTDGSTPPPPSALRSFLRQAVFVPDPQVYWIPSALAAVRRIARSSPPSIVLCSGPPFSAFLLGRMIKAIWRAPLALDYRDVWMDHPWWPVARWRQPLEGWMEGRLLASADLVVANHDSMLRMLLDRHSRISDRCIVVPNGFDPQELGPPVHPAWRPGEPFEIVYAGTLYGPVPGRNGPGASPSVQRPQAFLQALRRLTERGVFGAGGGRATFVGARPSAGEISNLASCARDCGVADRVRILPRMEKSGVVPILRRAHLLLNILYHTEAQVAQKVYDYLHLEIPILSLLRDTEANAVLVRRARAGPIVDPEDADGIERAVEGIVRDYAEGRSPIATDRTFVDRFDVRVEARFLGSRLRDLADHGRVAESRA